MSSSQSKELSTLSTLHLRRSDFANILNDFATNSEETFRVVYTFPQEHTTIESLKTLYVLDSSFNPPSRAHRTIARNAVLRDNGPKPTRLMLLLATENADKKAKPAGFEDRLVMMSLAAEELGRSLPTDVTAVDVAITKKPFYIDKARSIDQSHIYPANAQQVHIVGFDTIIRIFNPKYYSEEKKLSVLEGYFSKHRLRVCYRVERSGTEEDKNDRKEQQAYVDAIGDGRRDEDGVKREWREMIELVDDASEVEGVSSTKARQFAVDGEVEKLEEIVGKTCGKYIMDRKLYDDPGSVKK